MNKYDLEPLSVCNVCEGGMQLTRLLNQKLTALNVLGKFWLSKNLLLINLNVPIALQMLEKHYKQVNDLAQSIRTVLQVLWRTMSQTIVNLIYEVNNKCRIFCNEIALPLKSKLRQMS